MTPNIIAPDEIDAYIESQQLTDPVALSAQIAEGLKEAIKKSGRATSYSVPCNHRILTDDVREAVRDIFSAKGWAINFTNRGVGDCVWLESKEKGFVTMDDRDVSDAYFGDARRDRNAPNPYKIEEKDGVLHITGLSYRDFRQITTGCALHTYRERDKLKNEVKRGLVTMDQRDFVIEHFWSYAQRHTQCNLLDEAPITRDEK